MINESDWARLARHLAGEESAAETASTRRWIETDDERRAAASSMSQAFRSAQTPPRTWDSAAAWSRMNADALGGAGGRRKPRPPIGLQPRWRPIIVAITALAGAVALLLVAPQTRPARIATKTDAQRERDYRTAPAQRAVITLEDGTRVELGVDSRLRVRTWNAARRDVVLDGEAVFTVVHDSIRPFLVHSRNAIAEDLGTRFGVRGYPDDPSVGIVVAAGQVSLSDTAHTTMTLVRPGDHASLGATGQAELTHDADTTAMLAWTRDRFVARAMPLRDVARRLERLFDVRIEIADSLGASQRVAIDMPAARLTDILGAATAPLSLVYSQSGRTIVIRRPSTDDLPDSGRSRRSEP